MVSTEATYELTIGGATELTPVFSYAPAMLTVKYHLVKGWNWIYVNPLDDSHLSVNTLFASIANKVQEVRGPSGIVTTLSPDTCYQVLMSDDATIEIATRATGAGNNIPLKKGWNWISYRPFETLAVSTALVNLPATEGTIINVTSLTNSLMVETHFDVASNAPVGSDVATLLPDATNRRQYANNMCVVADVKRDKTVLNSENYIIASFVGDECRGISSLVGDKYFITVYGNSGGLVNYQVFDNSQGDYVNTQCVTLFNEKASVNLNAPTEVLIDHASAYDINLDGYVDISDLVKLVNIILDDDVPPTSADINQDGYVDISDVVFLVNWILEH